MIRATNINFDGLLCAVIAGSATVVEAGAAIELPLVCEAADAATTVLERPESISRFSRFKSARISEAVWYRTSRSFSSALLMIRSSSGLSSGFRRRGGIGALLRIASKITAVVGPEKA